MSRGLTRRRYLAGASAAGALSVSLGGCLGGAGGGDSGPILIGGNMPLSGAFAFFGQSYQQGAEFAVDQVNEEGGVLDRELELDTVDNEYSAQTGISAYERQVEDGAAAVIGPVNSDFGIQLSPRAHELQVPVMLHFSAAREALNPEHHFQFRTQTAPGFSQWKPIGDLVEENDWSSVGAIFADYSYGLNQQRGFEEFVESIQGVEGHAQVAPLTESDFTSYLRQMPDELDLLVTQAHPSGATTIASQAPNVGVDADNVIGVGVPGGAWWGSIGEAATGGLLEIRGYDPESRKYLDVASAFYEATEEYLDNFRANGYVAIDLLVQAVEQAGTAEPNAIRDALAENTYETLYEFEIDWTEYGEHTNWTVVYTGFESGANDAYPNSPFHLVHESTPPTLNPAELEPYDG